MFQIEIPRRSTTCFMGKECFIPGMDYYSLLLPREEDGLYERRDFCLACWEQQVHLQSSQKLRSSWKSVVPKKKELSELPKQRDARALYLLKEALTNNTSESHAEAFVLALYLARRRLIVLRQELKLAEGHLASLYEIVGTEEMVCVRKFSLSELQVDLIQTTLAKKFNQ